MVLHRVPFSLSGDRMRIECFFFKLHLLTFTRKCGDLGDRTTQERGIRRKRVKVEGKRGCIRMHHLKEKKFRSTSVIELKYNLIVFTKSTNIIE